MRAGNLFSSRGSAVLDAPEPSRAPKTIRSAGLKRSAPVTEMPLRRDVAYDYPDDEADLNPRERRGLRLSFHNGLIPKTLWGRIAAGCVLALTVSAAIAALIESRSFLLHDARFIIPNEQAIEIAGVSHLTHAQLLSIFGEDVDRNIFTIPLTQRRTELEQLPWVEHATVMRLLPDHIRIAIVERTPVAFVRQGAHIGLADATGALFDIPSPEMISAGGGTVPHYSFPVLNGISADDPLSTRAARMKIYMVFMAALDTTGEKISGKLSEVDISDPEDIRAIVPDAGGSDVLVHFGDDRFLERYHAYQQHLAEWRTQYPRLASVDMRYDQQVVLGMKPDTPASAPTSPAPTPATASAATANPSPASATKTTVANASQNPAVVSSLPAATRHAVVAAHPATPKSNAAHLPKHAKPHTKRPKAVHTNPGSATPPTHAISEVAR